MTGITECFYRKNYNKFVVEFLLSNFVKNSFRACGLELQLWTKGVLRLSPAIKLSSHTLFFYPLSSGNWEANKIN